MIFYLKKNETTNETKMNHQAIDAFLQEKIIVETF